MRQRILIIFSAIFLFNRCNSAISAGNESIRTDTSVVAKGETTFNRLCIGCHNFRQDGIGPQLGGLTAKVSPEWIKLFIKNPQKVINSGDERAKQMYTKFKTVMPSFATLNNND